MDVIFLPNDLQAATTELRNKAAAIQFQKIVKPIFENLKDCGLDNLVSFIYRGDVRDVEIVYPKFNAGMQEKQEDIEKIIFLMQKHGLHVTQSLQDDLVFLKKQIKLRTSINNFENWLLAHLAYLNLDDLEVETIVYSPKSGFLLKFVGLDPIKETAENMPSINVINTAPVVSISNDVRTIAPANEKKQPCLSPEEWKKQSKGYQWVQEQLKLGKRRKDIIYEFNLRHRKDPDNYSSREGKELSAAILSHWAKDTK